MKAFLATLCFPVILILSTGLRAQTVSYHLKGKLGTLSNPAKIFLIYQQNKDGQKKVIVDSTLLLNGVFNFEGTLPMTTLATLILDRKALGINKLFENREVQPIDAGTVYLENGNTGIAGLDSISRAVIRGGKLNQANAHLLEMQSVIRKRMSAINAEYLNADPVKQNSPVFQKRISEEWSAALQEANVIRDKFIQENKGSLVSLFALINSAGTLENPRTTEMLFNSLDASIKARPEALAFYDQLELAKKTAIGSPAPEFTQLDTSGKPVSLSSFKGKYVLLDFWASWCNPCRMENPNVVKAYQVYKSKNFTVLGVSLDRPGDRTEWLDAIKSDQLNWTQVSDLNYFHNAAAVLYHITAIPQNFLIDPRGIIVAKNLRGEKLEEKLAELLK